MKMIINIYIFILYILFIPGFLIKTKLNMQSYLLYSLLYSLVLYFTYDLVNQNTKENYNEYDVNVTGVNSLVDLIKTQFGGSGNEKKIDIYNQIAGSQGNNNINCWNALGKNQKEIEILKVQLDSYVGTKEDIDKLNNELNSLKQEVDGLENSLVGYKGTNKTVDQLNIQIKNYQDEINKLQQEIKLYNQTDTKIQEINKSISNLQSEITRLNLAITACTNKNDTDQTTINQLTSTSQQQDTKITSLQNNINNNVGCPPPSKWGEKVYYKNGQYCICMNGRNQSNFSFYYMQQFSGTLTGQGANANNLQQAYQYYQNNSSLFTSGNTQVNGNTLSSTAGPFSTQNGYWGLFLYNNQPIAAWEYSIAVGNGTPPC